MTIVNDFLDFTPAVANFKNVMWLYWSKNNLQLQTLYEY